MPVGSSCMSMSSPGAVPGASAALPVKPAVSPDHSQMFDQLFSVTDGNQSGAVDVQEFGELLEYARQQSGMMSGPISPNVVSSIFQQFDGSGDGVLSEAEFNQFFQAAHDMGEGVSTQPEPVLPGPATCMGPLNSSPVMSGPIMPGAVMATVVPEPYTSTMS